METKNEKQQNSSYCQCACGQAIVDRGTDCGGTCGECKAGHACLALALKGMAAPLYDRFDQLLDTAVRMLELLEGRVEPPLDLNEELIDTLDLKVLLKVGDTKFASMKKLFRTYEVSKKQYYLKHEVLEIIKDYEVTSDADNTDS